MIARMSNQQEALRILRRTGETQDDKVDLGEAALALAALDKKDAVIEPYRQHLAELGFVVGETVTVVNEISGNLILQVKEARIALDKTLAMRIIVA